MGFAEAFRYEGFQEGYQDGHQEGRQEGLQEAIQILSLVKQGKSIPEIVDLTGLEISVIQQFM